MQSLIQKLSESNIGYKFHRVSRTELFGKCSENMIHVAYLSKDTVPCKMYQVIFTGDRVLDIDLITKSLKDNNLSVQNTSGSSRSDIQVPIDESISSDFITVFDESLLDKTDVHVATGSKEDGFWVSSREMMSVFKTKLVLPISLLADQEGFKLDSSGDGFKKEMENVKKNMKEQVSTLNLPLLFNSTRKELEILENEDVEFLDEILRSDPFIYGHFLVMYFKSGGEIKTPEVIDIVNKVGVSECCKILKDMTKPGGSITPKEVSFTIGESIFKHIQTLTFLMTDVLDSAGERLGINPSSGEIIGRFIGYNAARWLCIGGSARTLDLSNQIKLNRHRSVPEIQRKLRGFTQLSLSMHLMKEFNFPSEISEVIGNHWNPFYQGEHDSLSSLLYIIRAKMEEDEILDLKMFSPVSRLHEMLSVKLGVTDEVNAAFKKLEGSLELTGRMSWRFREG